MISFRDVSFSYDSGTGKDRQAVSNVSLSIEKGSFVGIVGSVGSGKTTLCKLMTGLAKPTTGQVKTDGDIAFAMQFPESQLFESTVIRDVMFGPLNRGLGSQKAREIATRCLEDVGLDESFHDRSPLSLSGGEKRRVALAGVLAMEADILVLDEPASGLDRRWHDELFQLLGRLNSEGKTIVIVSHDMDDMAENCTSMIVMEKGRVMDYGKPGDLMPRLGLQTRAMAFAKRLKEAWEDIDFTGALTVKGLADLIAERRTSP